MLDIFICEDENVFRQDIEKTINTYLFGCKMEMRVACSTADPQDILYYLNKYPQTVGVYFLDYDLKNEIDGMVLAGEIRKLDARGFIIFVTSDAKSHRLVFEYMLEAMDYIVKSNPQWKTLIHKCLDKAVERLMARSNPLKNNIIIKSADGSGLVSVDCNTILYIRTNQGIKHLVTIHTTDGIITQRNSLIAMEALLEPKRFYRCQNDMIVNINKINNLSITRRKLTLDTREELDIPYRQIKKLKERIMGQTPD
ncbi:MAG: LytTR family DNA-binding domain-containing protein [Defluviitaleaceae bacterium]|nr:LytTR family DNA-binding domain-containing protein [Defluviitaleaceae bacterium]